MMGLTRIGNIGPWRISAKQSGVRCGYPPIETGILAEELGLGEVRPEARDKVLVLADATARAVGGASFQDGIDKTRKLLSKLTEMLDSIRTPEMLARTLDELDVAPENEWLIFGLFKFGPHLVRWIFSKLNEETAKTLPAVPSRQPAVPASSQLKMLQFINDLSFKHGVEIEIAKQRAARKFGCGLRTVQRYWSKRVEILASGPEPQFSDVIEGIKTAIENDV